MAQDSTTHQSGEDGAGRAALDQRLARAAALRSRIEEHNAQAAVQRILYNQFVNELAVLGLTPETLDGEIQRLRQALTEAGARLDVQLFALEAKLNSNGAGQ